MIRVYIDNFLLASKYIISTDWIKDSLKAEYNVKDLGEAKTIISWQVTWYERILKIDQSAFIQDVLEEKDLTGCNLVNILMKTSSTINISKDDNYKKAHNKVY